MSEKIFIGFDNGSTGSLFFLRPNQPPSFYKTPVKNCLNYTKKKAFLNRVDVDELGRIFTMELGSNRNVICGLERPMVNPGRFNATISGVRALEASLIVLEKLNIPYQFLDSKEWQVKLLPSGCEKKQLKKASSEVAGRLFPQLRANFKKDGDSALIAEYLRREDLPKKL